MAFNSDLYEVEWYQLKWLRVLDCLRGLAFESYVCPLCAI